MFNTMRLQAITEFHIFPLLPFDVRALIWEAAITEAAQPTFVHLEATAIVSATDPRDATQQGNAATECKTLEFRLENDPRKECAGDIRPLLLACKESHHEVRRLTDCVRLQVSNRPQDYVYHTIRSRDTYYLQSILTVERQLNQAQQNALQTDGSIAIPPYLQGIRHIVVTEDDINYLERNSSAFASYKFGYSLDEWFKTSDITNTCDKLTILIPESNSRDPGSGKKRSSPPPRHGIPRNFHPRRIKALQLVSLKPFAEKTKVSLATLPQTTWRAPLRLRGRLSGRAAADEKEDKVVAADDQARIDQAVDLEDSRWNGNGPALSANYCGGTKFHWDHERMLPKIIPK